MSDVLTLNWLSEDGLCIIIFLIDRDKKKIEL